MIGPETEAKGKGRRVEKFNKDFLGRALIKFQKLANVRKLAQAADNIFGLKILHADLFECAKLQLSYEIFQPIISNNFLS